VGLGIGLERTVLLLEQQQEAAGETIDVYLIGLGDAAERETVRLLHALRQAGLKAERDYAGRKMKAQLKAADRLNARYAAILGDDELARGEIALKAMATGEQRFVKLDELASAVREAL
ncbi:His/Gly/Thr/Pro-type tRNA ligase C-terminal domain-containing protein, partial [Thermobacillus xylanilyticus]|uniref:His/Gly/Thr/Pro-type tRNA ligase C-terminal domain-containing protein n=1 Tax=Thermobacillus xylanilyticus TaxID=76633 RepID=UPI001FD51E06